MWRGPENTVGVMRIPAMRLYEYPTAAFVVRDELGTTSLPLDELTWPVNE